MKKLKYIISRIFKMDFGRMIKTAREIAKEYHKPTIWILCDMVFCGFRYGAGYIDYQIFGFAGLSGAQRKTFVTRGINNEYIRKLNQKDDLYKFYDKVTFNSIFSDYIGRQWLYLKDKTPEDLRAFCEGRKVIIAKPTDAVCGKGIEKIPLTGDEDYEELYRRFVENGQMLIEECVVQHPAVSEIYAGSVNTLRLVTIVTGDKVSIVFRAIRIGAAGNVVDNFNSGGMFALVDENGMISTPAINKKTEIFETHPATGTKIEGFLLPYFKEAEELVRRAARVVPGMRYVGWDVAVTGNGPLLIEANHNPGHDILQSKVYLKDHDYGVRPAFEKAMAEG